MPDAGTSPMNSRMRRQETVFIVGFIVINLIGPIVLGERFPFTISPMFCDEPACYCEYFVTDANGREIDLASLKLQRVYDGNPVGLGVGIQPGVESPLVGANRCLARYAVSEDRNDRSRCTG